MCGKFEVLSLTSNFSMLFMYREVVELGHLIFLFVEKVRLIKVSLPNIKLETKERKILYYVFMCPKIRRFVID